MPAPPCPAGSRPPAPPGPELPGPLAAGPAPPSDDAPAPLDARCSPPGPAWQPAVVVQPFEVDATSSPREPGSLSSTELHAVARAACATSHAQRAAARVPRPPLTICPRATAPQARWRPTDAAACGARRRAVEDEHRPARDQRATGDEGHGGGGAPVDGLVAQADAGGVADVSVAVRLGVRPGAHRTRPEERPKAEPYQADTAGDEADVAPGARTGVARRRRARQCGDDRDHQRRCRGLQHGTRTTTGSPTSRVATEVFHATRPGAVACTSCAPGSTGTATSHCAAPTAALSRRTASPGKRLAEGTSMRRRTSRPSSALARRRATTSARLAALRPPAASSLRSTSAGVRPTRSSSREVELIPRLGRALALLELRARLRRASSATAVRVEERLPARRTAPGGVGGAPPACSGGGRGGEQSATAPMPARRDGGLSRFRIHFRYSFTSITDSRSSSESGAEDSSVAAGPGRQSGARAARGRGSGETTVFPGRPRRRFRRVHLVRRSRHGRAVPDALGAARATVGAAGPQGQRARNCARGGHGPLRSPALDAGGTQPRGHHPPRTQARRTRRHPQRHLVRRRVARGGRGQVMSPMHDRREARLLGFSDGAAAWGKAARGASSEEASLPIRRRPLTLLLEAARSAARRPAPPPRGDRDPAATSDAAAATTTGDPRRRARPRRGGLGCPASTRRRARRSRVSVAMCQRGVNLAHVAKRSCRRFGEAGRITAPSPGWHRRHQRSRCAGPVHDRAKARQRSPLRCAPLSSRASSPEARGRRGRPPRAREQTAPARWTEQPCAAVISSPAGSCARP